MSKLKNKVSDSNAEGFQHDRQDIFRETEENGNATLKHFQKKWVWYVFGLLALFWIEGILSIMSCIAAYIIDWFSGGLELVQRPIASLSLYNIGEIFFRIVAVGIAFLMIQSIIDAFSKKSESTDLEEGL